MPTTTSVFVGDRRVVHARGTKTQTVNICTPANLRGRYEVTFRLPIGEAFETTELAELVDLDALRDFLTSRNGEADVAAEGSARVRWTSPVQVDTTGIDASWFTAARAATEKALDALVDEFLEAPHLHRVEHSIHARLWELLTNSEVLSDRVALVTGEVIQLVHKEWPTVRPQRDATKKAPRGLFDIGILAPEQVRRAGYHQYRSGRITAPIVVEVGLDYGLQHLRDDLHKLGYNGIMAPYVLHLSRVAVKEQQEIEATLEALEEPFRAAYVHHDPKSSSTHTKRIDESTVWRRASNLALATR